MHAVRAAVGFDGERFLDGPVTVLVEDDRILGVEVGRYEPPTGCPVTSYAGTLLPGMVDTHVHLVADGTIGGLERAGSADDDRLDATVDAMLLRQAAAGVTTVRDLGDRRYRTLAARDRHVPGRPRVLAAGPPLTVPGGHCHYLGGEVAGEAEITAAVSEHAERGVDVVKVMATGGMLTEGTDMFGTQFSAAELALVVRRGHEAGLPVVAHAHSLAGARHALAAGVDGIEHFSCLTPEGVSTPEDLLEGLAAAGVVVCGTLGADPDRVPPPELLPPQVRELVRRLGMTPVELNAARGDQLRRVHEHGITLVSGTDAGVAPPKEHGVHWRAVVQLLDAGLTVAEALASGTATAATVCGVGDRTGRLAAGLAADLLVVDGDLRTDPPALGRPVAVWVRGARVSA